VKILIKNGLIVDGTGAQGYKADLLISENKIEAIGEKLDAEGAEVIDASERVVTPGFIDIHNHTDEDIEKLPLARNYMQQGVTSIIGGNCGESIYPVGEKLAGLERLGLGWAANKVGL